MRNSSRVLLTSGALAATLVLAGCSSDGNDTATTTSTSVAGPTGSGAPAAAPGAASATLARQEQRTVIDVRTPEEFASGHVEGAVNIDVQDPSFNSKIAALDTGATYVVYCRSGNRSATAATAMRAAGLDVLDGGAFTTMTAAGWPSA